jgi:hypothetical protein
VLETFPESYALYRRRVRALIPVSFSQLEATTPKPRCSAEGGSGPAPVVADGRMFVGTQNPAAVFGLLQPWACPPSRGT